MINAEYYKKEIEKTLETNVNFGVDYSDKIISCDNNIMCKDCRFARGRCSQERIKWLLEYNYKCCTAKEKANANRPDIIIKKYDSIEGLYDMTEIYKND